FMFLDVTGIVAGRAFLRWLAERLRTRGWQIQRALIVGNGTLGRALAGRIRQHPEYGIQIIGMVDGENGDSFHDVPVLGSIEDLPHIVREHGVQALFIALPVDKFSEALSIVRQFQTQPISIHMAMDLLTASHLRTTISEIDGLPLLNINDTPMQGAAAVAKRVLDIVLAALALILLAPLMLLIALLIKLTSRGPVIYRQIRMGLDGRPFVMYKFRTMVEDAEEATGPTMARPTDPRRTPVGKVLRFLSFDELPQFWNVLKGDMSLVGPRPERPYFVADFCRRYSQYMLRHRVKGGITGWAQVNGFRGDRDYERRIEYDLYYLTHWSIWLDLWILLVTPFRMFRYTGI
ncbi:MAG: undecaprenyl-phosphate glucose phosphotransferase, partial [Acidobacteria bacterium]|nr:undecaprenyl-phosphate glucose phosphotransferase [Acidobacteriota bacterium]MDW7985288.1 undecaprenyl-phosphate glucose phosphotransferase [Acidobacteriota bacterium]